MQVEGESGSQDVVSQKTHALSLCDGQLQPLYCKRIFGTHVDVAFVSLHGIGCDQHTFDHLVRDTLHNGTVHECTGIPFVAVAYDVAFFFLLGGNLFPLGSCPESAAAATSEIRFINFVYDVIRLHIKKCFRQGLISAGSDVFVDVFCIDMTTAFQDQACLPLEKRDIVFAYIFFFAFVVEKFMYDLATKNGFFKDGFTVVFRYFRIHESLRLYANQRSDFTESVAAAFLDADGFLIVGARRAAAAFAAFSVSFMCFFCTENDVYFRMVFRKLAQLVVHFFGSAGYASGSGAHEKATCFLLDLSLTVLFQNVQIGSAFYSIHSPHLESY